jgi:tRNA splicing endonuclease
LISASHTLTGSSDTYSNQVPQNPQFSKGAYTAAKKIAVENTIDNLGQKMALDYNILVTTDDEDTIITAKELFNATADVTSSNAGTYNVYKTNSKHVIAPRIATDANG